MDNTYYLIGAIAAAALVTFLIRSFPFAASKWLRRQRWITALGDFLPLGILVLLVAHFVAQTALSYDGGGWREAAAIVLTIGMQWLKRDALLSIFAGTCLYVLLRNGFLF